jgi:hypothetical protein
MSVDLEVHETTFEVTVLELSKGLTLDAVAKRHQGYVEKIANTESAWLPQGAYCSKLADDTFGVLFPANRQVFSRWMRDRTATLPMYLSLAVGDLTARGPQRVMAIDLEDAVSASSLESKLEAFTTLTNSSAEPKALARILESILGAKLMVTFNERATGRPWLISTAPSPGCNRWPGPCCWKFSRSAAPASTKWKSGRSRWVKSSLCRRASSKRAG